MTDKTDDPVARALDPEAWDTAMLNDFTLDLVMFPRRQESLVNARAARIAVIKEMIENEATEDVLDAGLEAVWENDAVGIDLLRIGFSAMLTAKLKKLEG